ncbi:MAG: hypothetical protein ACRD8W_00385 [Nitrososphaeraceae archaeon]
MPKIETYVCEFCNENIQAGLATITIERGGDITVSYVHNDCLEEQITESDFLEAVVLHD